MGGCHPSRWLLVGPPGRFRGPDVVQDAGPLTEWKVSRPFFCAAYFTDTLLTALLEVL